jgi:hypothetical protein
VLPKSKKRFVHVGESLYRYSSNRVQYAVFKHQRKLIWKSLETSDYELAKRKRDEELERAGKVDVEAARMSLDSLLKLYEENVCQYDERRGKPGFRYSVSFGNPGLTVLTFASERLPNSI